MWTKFMQMECKPAFNNKSFRTNSGKVGNINIDTINIGILFCFAII